MVRRSEDHRLDGLYVDKNSHWEQYRNLDLDLDNSNGECIGHNIHQTIQYYKYIHQARIQILNMIF